VAASKKAEIALRRCGASSRNITKFKQSIFFRYLNPINYIVFTVTVAVIAFL
jgi:hypothetical protein